MKNQKTKGIISLVVMVALALVLVFFSDTIYKALGGKVSYTPAKPTEAPAPTDEPEEDDQAKIDEAIANANGNYVPGTYEASAQGYEGKVTVKITVSEKAITKVEVEGPEETPTLGGKAMTALTKSILLAQSADVDNYASATYTSEAVIKAAREALEQAQAK